MPLVTGELRDIVGVSLAGRVGRLVFRLNEPNVVAAGSQAGRITPTAPAVVTPAADTSFSVDLANTSSMLGDAFYILTIEWNDSSMPNTDYPQWQIRVDSAGPIIEKIVLGPPNGGWGGPLANLSLILVSLTRPDNLQVGQLWLQSAPADYANPNSPLNTGKLYRGAR